MLPKNQLYYGDDNFDVLQLYLRDESVDLVYLDPPFNSRQDYNVEESTDLPESKLASRELLWT